MLTPNDYFPPFSEQEYENRRRTIRASMKEKGLDCLIVYGAYHWGGTDTGQVNGVYLSNYTAIPHSYVVLPLEKDPTLFISFAYHITNAKDCAAIEDVRVAGFDLITGVGNELKELGLEKGKIGIVGPLPSWWTITLPHEHHEHLMKTFPNATFETVTDWFELSPQQERRGNRAHGEGRSALRRRTRRGGAREQARRAPFGSARDHGRCREPLRRALSVLAHRLDVDDESRSLLSGFLPDAQDAGSRTRRHDRSGARLRPVSFGRSGARISSASPRPSIGNSSKSPSPFTTRRSPKSSRA